MAGTTFLGRAGYDLETALFERIAAVRKNDPYAPLTILVGSNLLGSYVKRMLAERAGGLFNVRFATFADLAETLARGESGGAGVALTQFADRVIAGELAASGEASTVFGRAAETRGFGGALLSAFSDLAESGCTAAVASGILERSAAHGRLDETAEGVLSLYVRFRERVEGLGGDVNSAFLRALSSPVPVSLGKPIFAYGFYDFNEMQRRLLAHLARCCDVTLFMPWGEGKAHRFVAATRVRLEQSGFETVRLADPPGGAGRAVRPRLLNVPDEEQEIREIARRIIALAVGKGVRFGDVALIIPSVETYAPLCREILQEAGIPFYLRAGSLAETNAAAKGALGLLAMLSGPLERRELVEFLVSAPLRSVSAAPETVDRFSLWVRRSAEAGIAGERGWIEESAALIERLGRDAPGDGDAPEALAAALEVDALIRKIMRARREEPGVPTWSLRARAFAALMRELFEESAGLETACGVVEGLAALDATGSGVSFEAFARIAEAALSDAGPSIGRFGGEGVNILSFAQARGLSFRAVFIPGLAERIFPTVVRQDPLLSDRTRLDLNEKSAGAIVLSERSERLNEEALLFELAREAAREELVCSYPRFEEGTGKERIPSSFLRFIEGYSIDGAHGPGIDYEWISRIGAAARGVELASVHELDFEKARGLREGSGYLPDNVFFSRGMNLVRGRWGTRRFTPYDGVFASKEALGELRAMLEEAGRRFAPTSLETYAGCPFDYFLTRVLGVEALEEPERMVSISPADRGILLHGILARIFGELKERGLLPVSVAPADKVSGIAGAIVERFLDEFPRTKPVGLPVFWEMEKRLVRESIRLFLEEERLEGGDLVPASFERSFGRKRDGIDIPYECAGRTVFFYGRIDRIDTGGGGRFRVVDYKTGKLAGKDQDLASGSALQLPIYLMAAARILGLEIKRGEACYRHVGTGEGKSAVVFSGSLWDECSPAFAKIIDVIARGIEGGVFFAPADDLECRSCDVRVACSAGSSRLFAIKAANDARAREYVEMRTVEEAEE
ncbi:MAG: PD-(D/E)XK nuclease family protein [Candidatus Krumholzibacteria bacterium]|nr:PD-(D/E)XK nuclease family protein [Candidatus Krumholzibacteria bacterium]